MPRICSFTEVATATTLLGLLARWLLFRFTAARLLAISQVAHLVGQLIKEPNA